MTTYTDSSLRHIRSLAAHGACFRTDDGDRPVTVELCEELLAWIRSTPSVASATYAMVLPGIDADFALLVNRDGTVESGTRELIDDLLWMR